MELFYDIILAIRKNLAQLRRSGLPLERGMRGFKIQNRSTPFGRTTALYA
jgi:hypothetical protein